MDWTLVTMRGYLEQPEVVANVNAWIADRSLWGEHGFWWELIRSNEVETVQWLFSRDNFELLGRLLVLQIEQIASIAVSQRAYAMLETLLESHVFVELIYSDHRRHRILGCLLRRATALRFYELFDILFAHGAHLGQEYLGASIFKVTANTEQVVETLIQHGAEIDDILSDDVVRYQDDVVEEVLKRRVDANGWSRANISPLHSAIRFSRERMVEILLRVGFMDVDRRDLSGHTPLISLASRGGDGWANSYICMAKTLLKYGADVKAESVRSQHTVLHYAMMYPSEDKTKFVEMLLQHGANPNLKNNRGRTPMLFLLDSAQNDLTWKLPGFAIQAVSDILDILLKYGADPFLPDNDGNAPVKMLSQNQWGLACMERNREAFRVVNNDMRPMKRKLEQ